MNGQTETPKTRRNERRKYKTASGALRDVVHRVYRGVLYFLIIIRVRRTWVNVTEFMPVKKSMASSAQSVTALATEQNYVQVPDTGYQLIQNIYVKSKDNNSITPLCKEWLSMRRYSRNLHAFSKMLWISPKPNLIHIGRKMHKTQTLHLRP